MNAAGAEPRRGRPGRGAVFVVLPAALIGAADLFALVYAALGASASEVERVIWGLYGGAALSLAMLVVIVLGRAPHKLTRSITMLSLTGIAFGIGIAVWFGVVSLACHGAVDCPLG